MTTADDGAEGAGCRVVGELVPDHGQQVDGDEAAAEEADHRQDADDEALAVADDGEPHGGEQQQDVQHVHRHHASTRVSRIGHRLMRASRAGPAWSRSQGRSQPAKCRIRSITPAVKPQTRADSDQERRARGGRWGERPSTRLAGSVRSATGTVKTRAVSAWSTAPTGLGRPPPAEHRGDDEAAHRDVERGQHAEDLHAGRVESGLLLRLAQRGAQRARRRRGSPSSGSRAPPGKEGWPACERRVPARSISSSSGPRAPSPKRTRTADWPPAAVSGGRKRLSCRGSTVPAARPRGPASGQPVGGDGERTARRARRSRVAGRRGAVALCASRHRPLGACASTVAFRTGTRPRRPLSRLPAAVRAARIVRRRA